MIDLSINRDSEYSVENRRKPGGYTAAINSNEENDDDQYELENSTMKSVDQKLSDTDKRNILYSCLASLTVCNMMVNFVIALLPDYI